MLEKIGKVIETDVLIVGAGAGGLRAALSARRHLPSGRVTLLDARMVGRSGHTAFSNAWMDFFSRSLVSGRASICSGKRQGQPYLWTEPIATPLIPAETGRKGLERALKLT